MFGVSDPAEIRVLEVLESELVSHWRDSEEAAWGAVIAVIAMARFALIDDVSQDNIGRRKVANRQVAQTVLAAPRRPLEAYGQAPPAWGGPGWALGISFSRDSGLWVVVYRHRAIRFQGLGRLGFRFGSCLTPESTLFSCIPLCCRDALQIFTRTECPWKVYISDRRSSKRVGSLGSDLNMA